MAGDITIETVGRSDLDALTALAVATYVEAFGHSVSPADLAAHLERHLSIASFERALAEDTILVAVCGERLIGFVQFGALRLPAERSARTAREIRRLYVESGYQDRVVGARLMAAALAALGRAGATEAYLDVWEHNRGARRFHGRHGFAVVGSIDFAAASGAPTSRDLIMAWRAP